MTAQIDFDTFFNDLEKYNPSDMFEEEEESEEEDDIQLIHGRKPKKTHHRESKWYSLADHSDDEGEQPPRQQESAAWYKREEEKNLQKSRVAEKRKEREKYFEILPEDDTNRLVISHKLRRIQDMKKTINDIESAKQDKEWTKIGELFKNLEKIIKDMLSMDFQTPPRLFIQYLCEFRDEVFALNKDRDYQKSLVPSQKKALSSLRNPIRHALDNPQYNPLIKEYKSDPDNFNIDEDFGLAEEEEELMKKREQSVATVRKTEEKAPSSKWLATASESDTESEDAPSGKAKKWLAGDSDDDTGSDDDMGNDSDSEIGGSRWLDQGESGTSKKGKKRKGKGKGKGYKKQLKKQKAVPDRVEIELNDGIIADKINEIRLNRGKRLIPYEQQMQELKIFLSKAQTDEVVIQVLTEIINMMIDKHASFEFYMSQDDWIDCIEYFERVLDIADSHPELRFVEAKPNEELKKLRNVIYITGNFCSTFELIDSQYIKALKHTDYHTEDYIERLKHQYICLVVGERVFSFYEARDEKESMARVASHLFFHLHHRKLEDHTELLKVQRTTISAERQPKKHVIQEDLSATLDRLLQLIYEKLSPESVNKALLMQIYHIAQKGEYTRARDLLIMSGLPENIQRYSADMDLQVLYNRAIAQLGLAAFRCGLIREVYETLHDLVASPSKELLAQALSRSTDKDRDRKQEVEKREKERLIPYHMHIPAELMETIYLVCAMLLEVPYTKQMSFEVHKKRSQSKALRRLIEYYARRVYSGPPENNREHIYLASIELQKGQWRECFEILKKINLWELSDNVEETFNILLYNIKIASLKAYLFTYSKFYDSIKLSNLCARFELDENSIHSNVSRMIYNEELYSSLDQPSVSLNTNEKSAPNELQVLGLRMVDRARYLSDFSERVWEHKSGYSRDHQQYRRRKYLV